MLRRDTTSAPRVRNSARSTGSPRLWLIDYAGHPFTSELARHLHGGNRTVRYSFLESHANPRGDLELDSPDGPDLRPIDLGRTFAAHDPVRRAIDEIHFGWRLARMAIRWIRPGDDVVSCKVPVISALMLLVATRLKRGTYTLWLQDIQSGIAALSAGRSVASVLRKLESQLVASAPHVISISEEFAAEARTLGRTRSITVLPNWAPLERIEPGERANPWSKNHNVAEDRTRIVYSGTLGSKHRGLELAELFERLLGRDDVEVIVVAGGAGVTHLESNTELRRSDRFRLLPLQPLADLEHVLATADVLVVSLADEATEACVPSKVLSYLCSERPVVALMNQANPSARLIQQVDAGVVVSNVDEATEAIERLTDDLAEQQRLGSNGRLYAEKEFAASRVTERFLQAMRNEPILEA